MPPPRARDDRGGIEAFNRALADATRRMDSPAVLALWEPDGAALLPDTAATVGAPAIRAVMDDVTRAHPEARMRSFEMTCTGIEIAGDLAHEYCDEHQIVDLGGGAPAFDGRGRMLFVLHRGNDGAWRLRREMWQHL
jgi:ketosteroid isomerase-like protein